MEESNTSPEEPERKETESLEDSGDSTNKTGRMQADESLESEAGSTDTNTEAPAPEEKKTNKRLKTIRERLNVYLVLLGAIVLMAVTVILIAYEQSQHSSASNTIKTQNLSQSSLNQLADSNSTVGSSQYVLNVESSAIFAGQVVMRQSLGVAGNLQVGGTAAFNNVSVAGTGQFGQATVSNNLTVGGSATVQGSTTIAKSLQVSGGGTFGGTLSAPQITTSTLQLNGNLVLQHHLVVGGPTPSRSAGPALGSGGSVSISGTDAAGSININTGSSPAAGCFVTINFSAAYNTTPHVLITPIGSAAGGLSYYVNRLTTSFSVCDASTPPAGSSFGFDYFVVD